MKKIFKWISISVLAIIGIIGIAFLLFLFFMTPARLTPIVNKYCNEYLNAKVTFDSVKVSMFEEFPMVSVKLVGGEIISYALQNDSSFLSGEHPANIDTLMRFKEFMISLNSLDLLKSKINIRRIRILQPTVNAYVSPSGHANWEIYTSTDTTSNEKSAPLDLNIDRFLIRGPAFINYESCPDSMAFQASIGALFLRGKITPDFKKLEINRFGCSKVEVNAAVETSDLYAFLAIDTASVDVVKQRREYKLKIEGMTSATIAKQNYCDSLPLKLNGTLNFNPANENFWGFKDFGLAIANLPEIILNGNVSFSAGDITSDLNCKVKALPLQSLLNLIPAGFSNEIQKIQTNVACDLNTTIKGNYLFNEKNKLPAINLDFKIPKGYLTYKDLESKIENITIDASFHYDPASLKSTEIKFRTINIESAPLALNGNIDATNLLNDPNVALDLHGTANLQELIKFAPEDLGITARGVISFDAKGSFLASRLNMQDLAKNDLVAQFNTDKLRFRIPKDTISLLAEKTFLELNTTKTRINKTTGKETRLLSFELKSDTARVRMPDREIIALSKMECSMRTSDALITGDTSRVIPMVGNLTAKTLEYSDTDSITMRLSDVKSNFRILPSKENRTLPAMRFDIESKQFRVSARENRFGLREASIVLDATKNTAGRRVASQQQLDSLQKIYPRIQRDSLVAYSRAQRLASRLADDFAGEDYDIKDTVMGTMLRAWTVTGNIKSVGGRVITPYFPLRTRLQNIDLTFTTNDITLRNTTINCGESKFELTGKIDGIRRAMSSGRGLNINAAIKADTLNANELLKATFSGIAYSESSDTYKKSLDKADGDDQLEKAIQKENENKIENSSLIIIPSNVTVDVKLDVNYGKYSDVTINKLTGELISRDRCLQLKDITTQTSIGGINLMALYATRNKKDITLGIDLGFKDIQAEKLIDIIPSIDSLLPMLSSFKGVVTSQFAATAALDTTMSIILSSLNAACRISGRNMVLMDGETFSGIANKLRFKNRKENLVDSISVEMLIRNNQIEVFPFIMQMDRYRTEISGIHNLDMTFNYHISVLKWQLPFSIGVNLSGNMDNLDKMKISLGKPKYKDTNTLAYTSVIDSSRLNLRNQINNFIQKGVDAARFTQFKEPAIDSTLIVKNTRNLTLTPQDSLALYKEGIIDSAPVLAPDSIP